MNNLNKITKILGVTFVLAASNTVYASTAPATATATVQNAFTLTEDTALDFGTVRATADNTGALNIAAIILAADGSVTTSAVGNASLTQLSPGSVGQFSVSGAAAFTDLVITFPPDFTLTAAVAPPGSPIFDVLAADWVAIVRGGVNDGVAYNAAVGSENLQTDNTGAVSFDAGTSLKTDATVGSTGNYIDDVYNGTYTMTVDY